MDEKSFVTEIEIYWRLRSRGTLITSEDSSSISSGLSKTITYLERFYEYV